MLNELFPLLFYLHGSFFPCPIVLSSLPLRGPYCITFPYRLGLYTIIAITPLRLSLVADIAVLWL